MQWLVRWSAFLLGMALSGAVLAQSTYVPMVPVRLMDTRPGGTTVDGVSAGGGPILGSTTVNLAVLGRGVIPSSGVTAVALNITVTNPTNVGFVTVWPTGATQPTASNLNLAPGVSISNQVIAKIGDNGRISVFVFCNHGSANVIVDVAGYFPASSDLTPLTPARLLDTRTGGSTVDGQFSGTGAIPSGGKLDLTVLNRGGVPAIGVSAVVLNVTAVTASRNSFITVWPTGASQPLASNLNVVSGQTIANLVMVAPGTGGKVSIYNNLGNTDFVVDVVGYFSSATATFVSLVPARLLDTRSGGPTYDGQGSGQGAIASGGTLDLTVAGRGNVPSMGVGAVALNITSVLPAASGYLVAWGSSTTTNNTPPQAMDINFWASSTIPSLVIAQVGQNGHVLINNNSTGATNVVADVVGWFPIQRATTVAITSVSGEPSIVNQPYSVQVSVTGNTIPAPTGTITVGDQNGSCTITLPATSCIMNGEPVVGQVTLLAVYSGDSNYPSASTSRGHIVNPATATEMCGLDPWATPNDPAGFVPLTQLSGIVYTPGIQQDILGSGALSLAITSPNTGTSTPASTIDVVGTFVGPTNTGITVNGVVAYTVNRKFLAPNVLLTAGSNTINVTATTLTGASATATTTITQGGSSSSPITFTVDSKTGASLPGPATIIFDIAVGALPNGASVQSIAIDLDGDGTYDYTAPTVAALPTNYVYYQPGLYPVTLKVIDSNSNVYLASRNILIQDLAAQRSMLCDIYAYLKDRLNAQDATGAASAYQSLVRSQYQSQFNSFGSNMPSVAAKLGNVANGRIAPGYADLTLVRDTTNQTRNGYPLRVTQGSDGVWRISEM